MIRLDLAEWIVELTVEPPALAAAMAQRYAAFINTGAGNANFQVSVTNEIGGERGQSILQASLRVNGEDYLLDGPQFYGMIAPLRGQAMLRMRSDVPAREVEYFLRVALAVLAWQEGGLLVHGAAVKAGNAVYLFVGQSGSGKSTVVRLSHASGRGVALSDDLVLLRRMDGAWRAYGTPFWNLTADRRDGQTANGPVQAIYKLAQDSNVFIEPMRATVGAAELLANCPVVNSQPALVLDLLGRCQDIVHTVGMQRLHFRKDDAFWDVIPC